MSAGQIHDLGYKRYAGSRRSVDTRWRAIMRQQLAMAWKGWWRYKLWLIAAVMATAAAGVVLYVASSMQFRVISGLAGQGISFADGILPTSTQWYCKIGFIVSLTIGSAVVAGDIQSGAFTFYFARSVRPRDYVVGKLVGLGVVLSFIMLAGPLVLAGLRLGLSDNLAQLIALSPTVLKALAIGGLGTLIYAAVPLGFSALVANRRYAMALWAAYYLVIGQMAEHIGKVFAPAISAIDLAAALNAVSMQLFEVRSRFGPAIPLGAALISIFAHAGIAIGLVLWRVRSAQRTGVGGSS